MFASRRNRVAAWVAGAVVLLMIALPFAFRLSSSGFDLQAVQPTTTTAVPDSAADEFRRALDQARASSTDTAIDGSPSPTAGEAAPGAPASGSPAAQNPEGGSGGGPASGSPAGGPTVSPDVEGVPPVTATVAPGGPKVSYVPGSPGKEPEAQCSLLIALLTHIAGEVDEVVAEPNRPEGDDAVRVAVLRGLRERQDLIDAIIAALSPPGQEAFDELLDAMRAFGAGTLDSDGVGSAMSRFQAGYAAGCIA